VTELFADLFVGEQQQLGVRQSDPANPEDGEAWLRDDLTDSLNDKIGELRWYVGSATNSVPIFDAGTSGTGITEELRVQINGQTGFLPVTQSGTFTEHRIQSGGETRTLTDSKALDVLFDILSISTNEPISVGEDLLVDYTVENTGSDQGTDDIDLLEYTDTVVDTQTKTLNAGEQTSDQLVWTTSSGDGGDRQITVRSSATSLSKTVSISEIPDSAVHHWLYSEGSGQTIGDAIGTADATLIGGTWDETTDHWWDNWAVGLDGVDDGVVADAADLTDPGDTGTVLITIRIRGIGSPEYIYNHQTNDDRLYCNLEDSGGTLRFGFAETVEQTTLNVDEDATYRLAARWDTGNYDVFLNDDAQTDNGTYTGSVAINGDFEMGQRRGDSYINGFVDNCIITDEALSDQDISDDYNQQPWS